MRISKIDWIMMVIVCGLAAAFAAAYFWQHRNDDTSVRYPSPSPGQTICCG